MILISDIHANLEALEQVPIEDHNERICLGDIIGYGKNPNECIKYVQENDFNCIKGNWEGIILNETINDPAYINKATINAVKALRKIESINTEWVSNLPLLIKKENFVFVHGGLANGQYGAIGAPVPEFCKYLANPTLQVNLNAFINNLPKAQTQVINGILIHGHTHLPEIYCNGDYHRALEGTYEISPGAVISIPSIGKNNSYAVIEENQITFYKI